MNFRDIHTCQTGFTIGVPIKTTTRDIAAICQSASTSLGDGYHCVPERIIEGGIQIVRWPGSTASAEFTDDLKCIRFQLPYESGSWPWISGHDPLSDWEKSLPVRIWNGDTCSKTYKGITRIKAFGGAPPWTYQELACVRAALVAYGWKCGALPRINTLSS